MNVLIKRLSHSTLYRHLICRLAASVSSVALKFTLSAKEATKFTKESSTVQGMFSGTWQGTE